MCNICGYSNCDWDVDDGYEIEEDDDEYERHQELREERYAECTCGAFQYSANKAMFIQIADCICGNT